MTIPKIREITTLLLAGVFLVIPVFSHAVSYYVDSAAGDDGKDGKSMTTPWKTIAKVNRSRFQPGDFILFKKGSVWREQLIASSSGTAGKPITFGAYGKGNKPVISGADIVRGWSLHRENIYVTTAVGVKSPSQLYLDGKFHDEAHYPNRGWLLATTNSSTKSSIIDADLTLTADKIIGATVVTRATPWGVNTTTAKNYDPIIHEIVLASQVSSDRSMRTGSGYYLRGMLWMLDSPGEWHHDPLAGRLYLWTAASDTPGNHLIEVPARPHCVVISGKKYITFQDLAITMADGDDLYIMGVDGLILKRLDVSGGVIGIHASCTKNAVIQNNIISNTLSNGIDVSYYTKNIAINDNSVNKAGNAGISPRQSKGGIYINGSSITAVNNSITESGCNGIAYEGEQITIRNNYIDRSCMVLDDCAGIYTWKSGNNMVSGNTVTNSIGNFNGTKYKTTQAHGIYLDDFTHDTIVSKNIISNSDYGIFVHTGRNNNINGNTVYRARMNGLVINENSTGALPGSAHGNRVNNNTFETISTGAVAHYYSTVESTTNFGTYYSNRYCHPNSKYAVRNQNVNYTLPAWRKQSRQDFDSVEVKAFCTTPAPTLAFTASPASVTKGGCSELTWTTTDAIYCETGGAWTGMKATSGSQALCGITASGKYDLICTGRGGATTKSVTVTCE